MIIRKFTFNPFLENTYIVYDETKECIIIDPGCYDRQEENILSSFIEAEDLKPVKLVLTHSHIDHVFGNHYVSEKYGIELYAHKLAHNGLSLMEAVGQMYGLRTQPSPPVKEVMDQGDELKFGNSRLEILHCPGHSPDSLVFYNPENNWAIGGDVLFHESIGRSDLPGGDFDTLIRSIKMKLFQLPDKTVIYSGHGPETTIGHEKRSNPFLT